MLIDSNLIIYATQPPYTQLRSWLVSYGTHYSGFHGNGVQFNLANA